MNSKNTYWLLTFFIITEGLWSSVGLGSIARGLIEFILVLWFLKVLREKNFRLLAPGFMIITAYVLSISFTALYHQEGLLEVLLYSRYFVYGWMATFIAYNIKDPFWSLNFFFKSLKIMVLFQVIASLLVFLVIGRIERIVGTMSSTGGSLATVWPLVFAPYFFIRYAIKGSKKDLLYIAGLLFIGFVSGKRGVYFLVPINVLLTYVLFVLPHRKSIELNTSRVLSFSSVMVILLMIGVSNTESLAGSEGFGFSVFGNAIDYAEEYSFNTSAVTGESIGRSSATLSMINNIGNNWNSFFGNGLSVLKGEISFEEYNIGYGITGFIREVVSVGIIGTILYVLFYFFFYLRILKVRKSYSSLLNSESLFALSTFTLSAFISILIVFFGYSRVFVQSLNPLFFYNVCNWLDTQLHKT